MPARTRPAPRRSAPQARERPELGRRPRRRRRAGRWVGSGVAACLVWVAFSLGPVLLAPGSDSTAARTAEWARDHHLGVVVGSLEKMQYQVHPPVVGGTPPVAQLRALGSSRTAPTRDGPPAGRGRVTSLHAPLRPLVTPGLAGEGVFTPAVVSAGSPVLQVAHVRPDAVHTSYLDGVAWIDHRAAVWELHPGYEDPGHLSLWSQPDLVPAPARGNLLATFNGGFKTNESRGGFYENGHTAGALLPGAASLVIYRDGHAAVGRWGTEVTMTPEVSAVRQNLQMLIDNGRITDNPDRNLRSDWGLTLGGGYAVWRSGVGTTARGDTVVVMGNALTAQSLADILLDAGAVRAMEMDINPEWMSFMWYTPTADPTQPRPHKLVDFRRPADRYFSATSRDFFALHIR